MARLSNGKHRSAIYLLVTWCDFLYSIQCNTFIYNTVYDLCADKVIFTPALCLICLFFKLVDVT